MRDRTASVVRIEAGQFPADAWGLAQQIRSSSHR
jgi:hypothetical protein